MNSQPSAIERARHLYLQEMIALEVPEHLREGLIRYLVNRIRPGSFLCAVLADDPGEAFARADDVSRDGLHSLALFLLRIAPVECWGSREAIDQWVSSRHDAHLGAVVEASMHSGER